MIFFDIKVADFVIKMSNCKKRAKKNTRAYQVNPLDFGKNLAGWVQCIGASVSQRMRPMVIGRR